MWYSLQNFCKFTVGKIELLIFFETKAHLTCNNVSSLNILAKQNFYDKTEGIFFSTCEILRSDTSRLFRFTFSLKKRRSSCGRKGKSRGFYSRFP